MRLTAEGLSAERGGDVVFRDVGFAVEDGQSLFVTGPNGAGKSTLLRVVAGLLAPATGQVRLAGGDGESDGVSGACHYLGHLNAMKHALSVAENLAFWQRFLGDAAMPVGDALARVGLGAICHLPFAYLSAGQKRRAAIARLLASRRPLWLLDEPTVGLDRASQDLFAALLGEHLDGGGMVVAATHMALGLDATFELAMEAAA